MREEGQNPHYSESEMFLVSCSKRVHVCAFTSSLLALSSSEHCPGSAAAPPVSHTAASEVGKPNRPQICQCLKTSPLKCFVYQCLCQTSMLY